MADPSEVTHEDSVQTPDLEQERESKLFGEKVTAGVQELMSGAKVDFSELNAGIAREPVGDTQQYVLTIQGAHPKVKVQTHFSLADANNDWRVSYRVGKAVA